jgi:membrane protease YdiL (CAAX protease family)
MLRLFREELYGLGQFLKRNGQETAILAFATLFIVLGKYHPIGSEPTSTFLYYGVFPLLVILLVLRKNPIKFGLGIGSPRIWGFYVAIICVIAAVVLYASSYSPSLQSYYLEEDFKFFSYVWSQCLILSASEFLYRGFLLFGLKEKFGEGSILIQMVPFVLLHLGKPELETISTILTGILFGWVAYRGRSFWPAFIIHMFINLFFVGIINWRWG